MKETYSMEEVTFMYSKATVNKADWENETYETVKRDEVREEYKRLMFIMKKIVRMFTNSEECVKVIEDKNFSVIGEDVRDVVGLLYDYEKDDIWKKIEKLLPLYDGDEENSEGAKKHRGTEYGELYRLRVRAERKRIRKLKEEKYVPLQSINDLEDEMQDVLKRLSEKKKDTNLEQEEECLENEFDILYDEICEVADILEKILKNRVPEITGLLDDATGRDLAFRKGTWNITK